MGSGLSVLRESVNLFVAVWEKLYISFWYAYVHGMDIQSMENFDIILKIINLNDPIRDNYNVEGLIESQYQGGIRLGLSMPPLILPGPSMIDIDIVLLT